MKNTECLYNAMAKYQRARAAARDEYLQTMKRIETAKGSAFYTNEREKARRKRDEAVNVAQVDARHDVDHALNCMREAINGRKMVAPTDEQLRILQMLRLRDHVTKGELDAAANAMNGNYSALGVVDDVARANGIPADYMGRATQTMDTDAALRFVGEVTQACARRINDAVGADRARQLEAARHVNKYGGAFDADDLPQERPYDGESDFFGRFTRVPYEVITKTLNAE